MFDEFTGERRHQPVLGIHRLHVVHHIDDQGFLRARIVMSKNAGVSVGGHQFDLGEAYGQQVIAQHARHLGDTFILRTDRWLPDPALKICQMLFQVAVDMRIYFVMAAFVGRDTAGVEDLVAANLETGSLNLFGRVPAYRGLRALLAGGEQPTNNQHWPFHICHYFSPFCPLGRAGLRPSAPSITP